MPDLVTLGEAFEDLIFLGLDRLPGPGEEVKTSQFLQTFGGGAVITAVAAARLGCSCQVYSGLGEACQARLEREGVRCINLRRRKEPHAVSAALSTRNDRSFVTYNGVNDQLEGRLLKRLRTLKARHLHFALQPRDCGPWVDAVRRLRARGMTCSWDFGWSRELLRDPHFFSLLAVVDLLFLNEKEALLYSKRRSEPTAFAAWRMLGTDVVVKLGRRGSCLISAKQTGRVAAPRVAAIDSTGAGDAFNGGFLVGRLTGRSPTDCLRLGNLAGSMSTRAAGGLDGLPSTADASWYLSRSSQ